MPLPSPESVMEDLREVTPLLGGAIRAALDQFEREHTSHRHYYTPRTQASVIHDLMAATATRALDTVPDAKCLTVNGGFVIIIGQKYIIKLKKMDRRLRTRNIPTQTVMDFRCQRPMQLHLPHVPKETHLFCGYIPLDAELRHSPLWATCPIGENIRWAWELDEGMPAEVVPLRPAQEASSDEPLFVVRDASPTKKTDDGNEG